MLSKTKKRTYDKIISTAVELIYVNGIGNVTMKQIAQSANVGRTTLYEYFKDKNELLKVVLKVHYDSIYKSDIEMKESVCEEEFLRNSLTFFADCYLQNPKSSIFINDYLMYLKMTFSDLDDIDILVMEEHTKYSKEIAKGINHYNIDVQKYIFALQSLVAMCIRFSISNRYGSGKYAIYKDEIDVLITILVRGVM